MRTHFKTKTFLLILGLSIWTSQSATAHLTISRTSCNGSGSGAFISTTIAPFWSIFSTFANMFHVTAYCDKESQEQNLEDLEKLIETDMAQERGESLNQFLLSPKDNDSAIQGFIEDVNLENTVSDEDEYIESGEEGLDEE